MEIITGLVSTIIPVYNRPLLVREAVESVLAQAYRPIEVILVDDGSTDETPVVLDGLASANPDAIRVIHKQNGGPGLAREAGRQIARGEFIQYLDSDDFLLPRKFELQVTALRMQPHCGVVYGPTQLVDGNGRVLESPWKLTGEAHQALFPALLVDRWWNTQTPLWRRSVCDAIGPWAAMLIAEDWHYEARAAGLGVRLAFVPDIPVAATRSLACGEHLSGKPLDRERTRCVAMLVSELWRNADRAGVSTGTTEMAHLARWSFAHARFCARWGLAEQAQEMLALARRHPRAPRKQMAVFAACAGLLGWRNAGRLAGFYDASVRRWLCGRARNAHPT